MLVTVQNPSPGPKVAAPAEKAVHIARLIVDTAAGAAAGSPGAGAAPVPHNIGPARPTDIFVFDHQPYHFAAGGLHPHPQVHIDHPETILHLSISQGERVTWWSEENFAILEVNPSHHDPNPGPFPFAATIRTEESLDAAGRKIFTARSTVPVAAATDHRYKIKFSIGAQIIDPDMSCGP
jgi:hypothetical protein